MPKHLQKSLHDCLVKIKKSTTTPANQLVSSNSFSSSKNWILSSCKRPKTQSFAIAYNPKDDNNNDDNDNNGDSATLSDIDKFLYENFNSLYLKEEDDETGYHHQDGKNSNNDHSNPISLGSPMFDVEPPPTNFCESKRFFVSPGLTGSLIEEARISLSAPTATTTTTSTTSEGGGFSASCSKTTTTAVSEAAEEGEDVALPDDCIAVLKYTPSPYDDFQRSMKEMVEARMEHEMRVDWDFMEELLFCYLNLNEKKSHKFILSAFVDLIVVLRRNLGKDDNKIPVSSRTFPVTRGGRNSTRTTK